MTTTKRASKKKQASREVGPTASRPQIPAGYGIPKHKKNLLPFGRYMDRIPSTKRTAGGNRRGSWVWLSAVVIPGRVPGTSRHG